MKWRGQSPQILDSMKDIGMKKMQLEAHEETSSNMRVKDFVGHMADVRLHGDGEIADMHNVTIPTDGKIRIREGAKTADSFVRRFEGRYGPDAVNRFRRIIEDASSSLADVGRHFGFTREYARRIYKRIYGFPYTQIHKKKILLRRLKADSRRFSSARLIYLRKAKDKLASMGLDPIIQIRSRSHSLVTSNNRRVAVIRVSNVRKIGNKEYLQITKLSEQRQACDFFILCCFNNGVSACYVIPAEVMPRKGALMPVSSNDGNHKYSMFKDAWHLLLRS